MLQCGGDIVLLAVRFFDVAKFTTLITPLSILISCKLSLLTVGLKIPSLSVFAMKSVNRIFMQ